MAADVGGKQVATEAQRLHRINKTAPAQALYNRVLQKVLLLFLRLYYSQA